MNAVSQTPVGLATPKIIPAAADGSESAAASGVGKATAAPPPLQIEGVGDRTERVGGAKQVGNVPKLSDNGGRVLTGQLEQTLQAIMSLYPTHGIDVSAIFILVIIKELKLYKAERQERAVRLTEQVSYLLKKADSLEKQGLDQLIGGVVKGAVEIGSGVIRGVGASKSAANLKASGGKLTPQEVAANAQATQMRFGAVADTTAAVGGITASVTDYLAKQEESSQTKDDASAQFTASQSSFSGETAGRIWSILQSIISSLNDTIDANHQMIENSNYTP